MSDHEQPPTPKPDGQPTEIVTQLLEPSNVRPFTHFQKGLTNRPRLTTLEKMADRQARKERRRTRLAKIRQRRIQVYDLWVCGASYRAIAAVVGVSHVQVTYDIKAMQADMREHDLTGAENDTQKMWWRGEKLSAAMMQAALNGNTDAGMVVERIRENQMKLKGLAAPIKVASTTPDGLSWAPIAVGQLQRLSDADLASLQRLSRLRLLPEGPIDTERVG